MIGPLDVGCAECRYPADGITIGSGGCNKCNGSGIDGFSKCRRCRDANGTCPRCNGRGYHPEHGPPYPPEPSGGDDTGGGGGGGGSGGGLEIGDFSVELFRAVFLPEGRAMRGFRGIYYGTCATFWFVYLAIPMLHKLGLISPETVAPLERWFKAFVETPLGIGLLLFFSVGMLVIGFFLIKYILIGLAFLIPVLIVLALISIVLDERKHRPASGGQGVVVPVPTVSGEFYHLPLCADARRIALSDSRPEATLRLHENCWSGPIAMPTSANVYHTADDLSLWFQERYFDTAGQPVMTTRFRPADARNDGQPLPQVSHNFLHLRGNGIVRVVYTKR